MISSIAEQQITLHMKDIIRLSTRHQEETTAQMLQTIWEQARATASHTEIRTGQLLLLVGTDPLWQIAGTIYAGLSGRHYLVEETGRAWQDYISEAPNGLLLCGPRTAFAHERVNGLLAAFQLSATECLYAQRYREEQRGTFALLTASSLRVWLRTAQKILAWTPHPHPTITYFLPLEDEKLLTERRDDITFMNRETANVAALRGRQQDVLAITSHGTDDMSYIGSEDVICGFAGEIDQIQKVPGQVYPACAHDRHCNRSGARLRADHIQSTFTLLNSCMGLRLTETRYPGEFSLGLNFLTGNTTHLIASNQIKEGDSVEAAFLVQLLRAGIPCGEAVRLTNNALFVTDMNAPSISLSAM